MDEVRLRKPRVATADGTGYLAQVGYKVEEVVDA